MTTITALVCRDPAERKSKIQAILARGNTVCFTNRLSGIVKLIIGWQEVKGGDLVTAYTSGQTPFLCWDSVQYEISELPGKIRTKEEYDKAVSVAGSGG